MSRSLPPENPFGVDKIRKCILQQADIVTRIRLGAVNKKFQQTYRHLIAGPVCPSSTQYVADVKNSSKLEIQAMNGSPLVRAFYTFAEEVRVELRRQMKAGRGFKWAAECRSKCPSILRDKVTFGWCYFDDEVGPGDIDIEEEEEEEEEDNDGEVGGGADGVEHHHHHEDDRVLIIDCEVIKNTLWMGVHLQRRTRPNRGTTVVISQMYWRSDEFIARSKTPIEDEHRYYTTYVWAPGRELQFIGFNGDPSITTFLVIARKLILIHYMLRVSFIASGGVAILVLDSALLGLGSRASLHQYRAYIENIVKPYGIETVVEAD